MTTIRNRRTRSRPATALFVGLLAIALLACSTGIDPGASPAASAAPSSTGTGSALFDASRVHDITLTVDEDAVAAALATYAATGEKAWIEATLTIDGSTYERVGIRLKGNSSLRSLSDGRGGSSIGASDDPATLPWLIDLDQFVDGQAHEGVVELVVRSSSTQTALNEAVALELLERAGLASQQAIAARFRVNDGEAILRLVVENPDDVWMADAFSSDGALYKAESSGDYSYRGEDPSSYAEVFDQEAGKDDADLGPLIDFLQFVNESDDATFAEDLAEHLDVDAFVTYLAMQEVVQNFDDIDGPGNNSYLYYDPATGIFTVVPWDYNLAFGVGFGAPGGEGGAGFGGPADGDDPPPGDGAGPRPGGGPDGRSNVLVERFLAIDGNQALVDARTAELKASLLDSGEAEAILADWVEVLTSQASDLVDPATVEAEAEQVAAQL
ncbi:MAG: CotH kinase family protein [Chloroflexota bacterium]